MKPLGELSEVQLSAIKNFVEYWNSQKKTFPKGIISNKRILRRIRREARTIYINGYIHAYWKIRRALTPCTELRLTLENFIKMTHKTSWLTGQIKNGLYFLSLHVFRILSPESSIW